MMPRSLLPYFAFLLFFTISFSTENQPKSKNSLLENEIVPKTTQKTPTFKLYDFLIYPSNGTFKISILPFISSSENLLKIHLHFQKLDPNVNLDKFLPYSTIKRTVLDLQDSEAFVYIFQDEYQFFNPIVYSENDYKICTMDDKNIKDDDIYALVSPNKIFSLETYIIQKNLESWLQFESNIIYAACDQENGMFFVAIKTNQGELTAISNGSMAPGLWRNMRQMKYPDDLDCILEAHNLTGFSKIYFNVFDFFHKYDQFVWKNWGKIMHVCNTALEKLDNMLSTFPRLISFISTSIAQSILVATLFLPFLSLYHFTMFYFHILSIPLEFFLIKKTNCISENFMYFWVLPNGFFIIFSICFPKMILLGLNDDGFYDNTTQIKPLKTMWAVKYLVQRKKVSVIESICPVMALLLAMFWWGLCASVPLLPLFMIYGEAYCNNE